VEAKAAEKKAETDEKLEIPPKSPAKAEQILINPKYAQPDETAILPSNPAVRESDQGRETLLGERQAAADQPSLSLDVASPQSPPKSASGKGDSTAIAPQTTSRKPEEVTSTPSLSQETAPPPAKPAMAVPPAEPDNLATQERDRFLRETKSAQPDGTGILSSQPAVGEGERGREAISADGQAAVAKPSLSPDVASPQSPPKSQPKSAIGKGVAAIEVTSTPNLTREGSKPKKWGGVRLSQ
jgi:hypothetical protein